MGAHRDDCPGVERHQRVTLLCRQAEAVGITGGIGKKGRAACLVMREAVQRDGQFDELGLDRRVVGLRLRPDGLNQPSEA